MAARSCVWELRMEHRLLDEIHLVLDNGDVDCPQHRRLPENTIDALALGGGARKEKADLMI